MDEVAFNQQLAPHKAFITPKRLCLPKSQWDKHCLFICNDAEAKTDGTELKGKEQTLTQCGWLKTEESQCGFASLLRREMLEQLRIFCALKVVTTQMQFYTSVCYDILQPGATCLFLLQVKLHPDGTSLTFTLCKCYLWSFYSQAIIAKLTFFLVEDFRVHVQRLNCQPVSPFNLAMLLFQLMDHNLLHFRP